MVNLSFTPLTSFIFSSHFIRFYRWNRTSREWLGTWTRAEASLKMAPPILVVVVAVAQQAVQRRPIPLLRYVLCFVFCALCLLFVFVLVFLIWMMCDTCDGMTRAYLISSSPRSLFIRWANCLLYVKSKYFSFLFFLFRLWRYSTTTTKVLLGWTRSRGMCLFVLVDFAYLFAWYIVCRWFVPYIEISIFLCSLGKCIGK